MLRNLLNNYISRLKGYSYQIDENVPTGYLLNSILSRLFMKMRGLFSGLRCESLPYIGNHVTIKAKRKIRAGRNLQIGNHCYIDALSSEGIILGNNVSIGYSTTIECTGNIQYLGKGLSASDNVGLGSNNFYGCAGGIYIGEYTIVGNFVSFHAENHIFSDLEKPIKLQGVTHQGIKIGRNCWIGAKATVLDGAIIEEGCIIAAGAVVGAGIYKKNGIYGGVPAKLIKYRT
jgi:acetyltransferase-like isoleucine patch superfamily enzyme